MELNWLFITITLAMSLLLWMMPTLSRPGLFFGVTVSPSFRNSTQGRQILGRYRQLVVATAVLGLVTAFKGRIPVPFLVVILSVVSTLGWAWGHRMARPHAASASSRREASLGVSGKDPHPSGLARLGPFLILASAGLYLYFYYDLLPDPLPVHWSGPEPDRFVPKTWLAVFRSLMVLVSICLLMEFTKANLANPNFTRRILDPQEDDRESKFFGMQLRLLLAGQYFLALMYAWTTFVLRGPHAPQWIPAGWKFYGGLILTALFLPISIYLSVRYGQGGSRLPADPESLTAAPRGDRTPDECWKLGQFYFNPDDAAVWVEKRAGVGYTLNFARPLSWLWLFGVLAGPLILIRLLR